MTRIHPPRYTGGNMYHLTQMWLAIVALTSLGAYTLGRIHGRRSLQRQLRGDEP